MVKPILNYQKVTTPCQESYPKVKLNDIKINIHGTDPYNDLNNLLERLSNKLRNGETPNTFLSKYINNGLIDPKVFIGSLYRKKHEELVKKLLIRDYYLNMNLKVLKGIPGTTSFDNFEKWKNGETGYPYIDACMKCLKETNYLKYKQRALVASFWVKKYNGDWRLGCEYFKCLDDYDETLCTANWLYSAGIIDPIKFRKWNYDPDDEASLKFIKTWLR